MLERNISKREALSLATMLESGLISYKHYMAWVDERIQLEDEPKEWLIQLSTTKLSIKAAGYLISFAYSCSSETLEADPSLFTDEYVACEWLRFQRNEISWATFLCECGQFTDAHIGREGCEYFFERLNELEDSDYSFEIVKSQSVDVYERFLDTIQTVEHMYNEFLPYLCMWRSQQSASI